MPRITAPAAVLVVAHKVGSKTYYAGEEVDGETLTTFRSKREADAWAYRMNESRARDLADLPAANARRECRVLAYLCTRAARRAPADMQMALDF